MAENVTITTFLELKDNMSAGLKKVEAALKNVNQAQTRAVKTQEKQAKAFKPIERNAAAHAQQVERAAKVQERAQREAVRQSQRLAKQQEKERQAIARAMQGPKNDPVARMHQQERIARRLAKAQERERQAIARAMQGPKNDPAERARAQERVQKAISRAMYGPKHDPAARAQEQIRAQQATAAAAEQARRQQARATDFAARQAQRQKALAERLAVAELKAVQRAHAAEVRSAELAAKRKAAAELREMRRVEVARNRAAKEQARQQKAAERQKAREKADRADFIGKAGAAMFGPSIGGIIAAAFKSPMAALQLSIIGMIEAMVEGVKSGLQLAFDLTKKFVVKVFEVGKEYQENIRRVSMILVGMDVTPTYEIATKAAEKYFNTIRELAAKLPGEAQDYLTVFSMGLPKALQQGEKSVQKFAEMSSKFTAFGLTMGQKDVQQLGRDIARIMQGHALATTAMFRQLEPYIGMAAKEFNKLKPTERMVRLYAAIEKSTQALPDTFQDADALLGTMNTRINELFRVGGQPLFKSTLAIIARINDFLEKNNGALNNAVTIISKYLGDALLGASARILELAKDVDSITRSIKDFFKAEKDDMWITLKFKEYMREGIDEVEISRKLGEHLNKQRDMEEKARVEAKHRESVKDPLYRKFANQYDVLAEKSQQTKHFMQAARRMSGQTFSTYAQRVGRLSEEEATALWQEAHPHRGIEGGGGAKHRKPPKGRQTTINDFRFSKFDIRQEFAEGFDPDRIAVAFASDLSKLGEMRMQSAYAPLYSSRY